MFLMEAAMLELFKYDEVAKAWILVDYGVKSKALEYELQGCLVVLI